MSLVAWDHALTVGDPAIDGDHRAIIIIINDLNQTISEGDASKIDAAIDQLDRYAVEHFDREAALMAKIGFAERAGHLEDHEKFYDQFRKFRDDYRAQSGARWADSRLLMMLASWWVGHIKTWDMRLAAAMKRAVAATS